MCAAAAVVGGALVDVEAAEHDEVRSIRFLRPNSDVRGPADFDIVKNPSLLAIIQNDVSPVTVDVPT